MTSHLSRRSALRLGLGVGTAAALGTLQPASAHADGQIVRGSFPSRFRNWQDTAYEVLYPPGHGPGSYLPVLICLHGTGGDQTTPESMRYYDHMPAIMREGYRPFVAVGVAGGDTWWHGRLDGTDSSTMVDHELIPLLGRMGLDVRRPALYGLSMGGVGAMWLASWMKQAGSISSLVVASAPIIDRWDRFGRAAYETPESFAYNDVRRRWPLLEGLPIRVDVGDQDQFYAENVRYFSTSWPRPEFNVAHGGHSWDFWSAMAGNDFRFVSSHF